MIGKSQSQARRVLVFAVFPLGLAIGVLGCGDPLPIPVDPQARAELSARVSQMASLTDEPEALRVAAEALFAAGSEEAALGLLKRVEGETGPVQIQIARYLVLQGREDEGIDLLARAIGSCEGEETTGDGFDALVVEAAKMAAATGSRKTLNYLQRLTHTHEISGAAAAEIVIAACEIAVTSEDWRLLEQASSLIPLVDQDEARDQALLALTWATAHLASNTADSSRIKAGSQFADRISDRPLQAGAFALLAEAAHQLWNTELMQKLGRKMDAALEDAAGSEVVEGLCRVALGFRLGGDFSRDVLNEALDYARKILQFPSGKGTPSAQENRQWQNTFGFMHARYFGWIARAAVELQEPEIVGEASREAIGLIRRVDPRLSLVSGFSLVPLLESIEYLDSPETQEKALSAYRHLANQIPDPIGRSMALGSVAETAGRIAVEQKAPEFREVAWQSLLLIPILQLQKGELAKLSYSSARLGDPRFVSERLSTLLPAEDPEIELAVAAAALKGLAESQRQLAPAKSRFVAETHLSSG